jgi:hypothetical protein
VSGRVCGGAGSRDDAIAKGSVMQRGLDGARKSVVLAKTFATISGILNTYNTNTLVATYHDCGY